MDAHPKIIIFVSTCRQRTKNNFSGAGLCLHISQLHFFLCNHLFIRISQLFVCLWVTAGWVILVGETPLKNTGTKGFFSKNPWVEWEWPLRHGMTIDSFIIFQPSFLFDIVSVDPLPLPSLVLQHHAMQQRSSDIATWSYDPNPVSFEAFFWTCGRPKEIAV